MPVLKLTLFTFVVLVGGSCAVPSAKESASWGQLGRSRYSWMWPKRSPGDTLDFTLRALHMLRAHPEGVPAALGTPRPGGLSLLPGHRDLMLVIVPPDFDMGGLDYWVCHSSFVTNDPQILEDMILGLAGRYRLDFVLDMRVTEDADGCYASLSLKKIMIDDGTVSYKWLGMSATLHIFEYNGEPVADFEGYGVP